MIVNDVNITGTHEQLSFCQGQDDVVHSQLNDPHMQPLAVQINIF